MIEIGVGCSRSDFVGNTYSSERVEQVLLSDEAILIDNQIKVIVLAQGTDSRTDNFAKIVRATEPFNGGSY